MRLIRKLDSSARQLWLKLFLVGFIFPLFWIILIPVTLEILKETP